jgi:ABC-type dipeptide/oligopeptide/nickel transport system permease component
MTVDIFKAIASAPGVIWDILPSFLPYALVCGLFAGFVVWNGGIVLGMFSLFPSQILIDENFQVISQTIFPRYIYLKFTTASLVQRRLAGRFY